MSSIVARFAVVAGMALVASCGKSSSDQPPAPPSGAAPPPVAAPPPLAMPDRTQVGALFKPLPASFDLAAGPASPALIELGRQLYADPRLSKSQEVSCNTCHGLATFGVDNLATSKGHRGQLGARNSPTVMNAAGQFVQFWDGRAATVEEQAKGPMLNPVEMAMPDEAHVVAVVRSIPGYVKAFADAFPGPAEPITFDTIAAAIGAFERQLVTPAPFDRYLAGDDSALSAQAQHGLAVFMASGCTACHSGPLLGGTTYMKTGLVAPYANAADLGRFAVTGVESDRFLFKVPTLRNIAKTAPYFHDGAIADLPTAIKEMGRIQLAKTLTDEETQAIVAFFDALTGAPPAALVAAPTLPPSGPKTPKPDPS
ncbi:MAG: cytochrome c peroxidase [Kofleriaceae bacterium]